MASSFWLLLRVSIRHKVRTSEHHPANDLKAVLQGLMHDGVKLAKQTRHFEPTLQRTPSSVGRVPRSCLTRGEISFDYHRDLACPFGTRGKMRFQVVTLRSSCRR